MPESIFAAMLRTGSWASRAACRSTDEPNIFFPRTESVSAAQHAAEAYCNECPVRPQCLDQALASGAEGIWAGTSSAERRKLARTRNRERCPLCTSEKRIFIQEPAGHTDHELCLACGVSWKVSEGPGSPAWTAKYTPSWKTGTYDATRTQDVPTPEGML